MIANKVLSLGFGLALAAAAVLPAAAATAHTTSTAPKTAKSHHTYYYVSHKPHGKGCEIVNHHPSKKMMVGKYYYSTHKAAAHAMKADKACHA